MTRPRVPNPKPVRDLLADLLGRSVDLTVSNPYAPMVGEPSTLAVFVDDATVVRAVMVADLAFSAYAGAAIGLVPLPGAESAIEDRQLPQAMQENLSEVLNICASLLNAEGLPHVRLYQVYAPGGAAPAPELVACAQTLGGRLDLRVEIGGYGAGRFSVVVLG